MLGEVFRAVVAAVTAVAVATPADGPQQRERPLDSPVVGADVSWPNCPKGLGMKARPALGKPLPRADARFVVIGLTNGPAFHPNPCLVSQVAYAAERGLHASAYAVVTYPTRSQLRAYGDGSADTPQGQGRLWNTGYAQARQNVDVMRSAGLDSPAVWLDVEPVTPPAPWSKRPKRNREVVDGALAAYRDAGLDVGFYSVRSLWRQVLGGAGWGLPEWRSAGPQDRAAALAMCRQGSFNGGPAVLAQWWDDHRDHDVLCPGTPPADVLDRWFVDLAADAPAP
ncbi:MAG: hypothetical protein HOQ22_16320 [Nocardioidaceae bacterium]|nr:hypothetical protein [Nocardioidaceae bacterium]NUS52592.1 hypothetical protein [Nocardioidaceae bacterium]